MKKKILMVSHSQFGYIAGYVQYCKYLKSDYDITYLCWDYEKDKMEEDGVIIHYISRNGNLVRRNLRFIVTILRFLKRNSYHCVFMCYFQGCSIIPMLYGRKQFIHLNIMTGNVSWSSSKRKIYNSLMRFESSFFSSVSTISESLRKFLKISTDTHIFPLGADPVETVPKPAHELSMLYVGTFSERKIEDTVEGLAIFLRNNPNVDVHYTIVGDGWSNEVEAIKEKIKMYQLEHKISMEGYVLQENLKPYFAKSNIGVAHVPMTPYYDCQPSTKVYEYLMAGIPVIATATYENRRIINDNNGVIIDHTPEDFALGLEHMYKNMSLFDPETIKDSVAEYKWKNIVGDMKDTIGKFSL